MNDTPAVINPAVVKKQCKRLCEMTYGGWRFKPSHLSGYAKAMAFAVNLAAEARLVVTAQNTGNELSLWVEGTPDELEAFFRHMYEVREEKARKAEAVKSAKKHARELVKQAEAADYSNSHPITDRVFAKPELVKGKGGRVTDRSVQ
jgi:hypothetical protein